MVPAKISRPQPKLSKELYALIDKSVADQKKFIDEHAVAEVTDAQKKAHLDGYRTGLSDAVDWLRQ